MARKKLNLERFEVEKLSKKQQKAVQGGDDPVDGKDPIRGGGDGGTGTLSIPKSTT